MLNDMVVDEAGRAYVDNSGYNPFGGEKWTGENYGSIILVEPDGNCRVVASDLAFPNGILLTREGRLVVAESRLRRLTSFAVLPDGALADRRVEAELEGDPDGFCLDLDGGFWIGLGKTQKFVRWLDHAVVEEVDTPGYKAVACQLGGPDGKQFFGMIAHGETSDIGRADLASICTWPVGVGAAGSP
jgi:sugar lactone lactonase YvrE